MRKHEHVYQKLADYINDNEFFWLSDLRKHFGALNAEAYDYPINNKIRIFINAVKKSGHIQCCENKGSEKQYMRVSIIYINEIKFHVK